MLNTWKNELRDKQRYIQLLANNSPSMQHELLEYCIDYYGVDGLYQLSAMDLHNYCEIMGLL